MSIIVDGYCRVSTDPQEENSSLEEQETAIRAYCTTNGLIVGIVHREVFSGYQYREREKLGMMRDRYREGIITGVVIRTLDRLSRSQVHNAIIMEEMEHYGVTLHCVKENIDDTPMGKFIRMVLAFVSEMEREKIMDRTITGRISKARQGHIVSGSKAPYGYEWRYERDATGKVTRKEIIINWEQAEIVRWVAEQYANGVASWNIVQQLNARGVPSPNGFAWRERTVHRIIVNERYTGKNAKSFAYQHDHQVKGKKTLDSIDLPDGTYPPIISEELFERIKVRREINKQDSIRATKEPEAYLLRAGFVRCGYCNKPMMVVKERNNYVYRCQHTYLGHTNSILSKPLDLQIWEWLQQLAEHVTLIEKAVEIATSTNKTEKDAKAIEASIETWKTRASNYLVDLEDPTLIGDTRVAVRSALNNANVMVGKLEAEKVQIAAGMIDKERERKAYQDILDWCRNVKEAREELTYQRKRDFLHMLGAVVVVMNEKPYYENFVYSIELKLPAIQELITPFTDAIAGRLPRTAKRSWGQM